MTILKNINFPSPKVNASIRPTLLVVSSMLFYLIQQSCWKIQRSRRWGKHCHCQSLWKRYSWVWLFQILVLVYLPAFCHRTVCKVVTTEQSQLYHLYNLRCNLNVVFLFFFLWRYGDKCGQVLGNLSSSKIPRTRDLQSSRCSGDLSVDMQCISFINYDMDPS